MCDAVSLWHESFHGKSQQFGPRVSENSFNLGIHVHDSCVSISYDERVRRTFKEAYPPHHYLVRRCVGYHFEIDSESNLLRLYVAGLNHRPTFVVRCYCLNYRHLNF